MLMRPLPPQLQQIVELNLNEDPERRQQDLLHIKTWLKKQRHLCPRTDDQWLLTFLRGCKFSLAKTKQKLETYYTMRTALPEFFSNRDPHLPQLQQIMNLGMCFPLPEPDNLGRRVFFFRIGVSDPNKMKLVDFFKLNYMNMDIVLAEDDRAIICGDVTIIDLQGITLAHATQLQPALIKRAVVCYQEAYPIRPQSINVINIPAAFESVLTFIMGFIKDELKQRIVIHPKNDLSLLYQTIPQKILPIEYGGCSGTIKDNAKAWKDKVEEYSDWFKEDSLYCSDESKRIGQSKLRDDLFGLEGSFRTLNVD
uniref:CRAL-TRIO domain-containing protein n=2 Tax=Clastoptera arizonana TaxID=38151 RepID=A0A1B6DLZ3_9HEMI